MKGTSAVRQEDEMAMTLSGRAGSRRGRLLDSSALNTRAALIGLAVVGCAMALSPALANPQGGTVVGGDATIRAQPGRTTIDQASDRAIINWDSFSIAPDETTRFNQPGRDSIALNRVTGATASEIAGTLEANGNVWLVNPNGVLIQRGARIDVNGLLATTANIADEDFLAGRFDFDRPSPNPQATVVNKGEISIGERGLAALVAPGVANSGTITGQLGQVVLAGAPTFTLDFAGDGLINFDITSEVAQAPEGQTALVSNDGRIIAPGGSVRLSASAAAGVVDEAINVAGLVQATAVTKQGGTIVLSGGDNGRVTVAGTLDASGRQAGRTGGRVEVLGERVALVDGARVDASGDAGGGTVLVGGNYQGKGPRPNATRTYAGAETEIAADALTRGDGGTVILWADDATHVAGAISARGGAQGGDGGFVETSGKGSLQVAATADVDTGAPAGERGQWLLDPTNIQIVDGSVEPTDGVSRIDVAAINAAEGDIILEADNDVTIEVPIDMSTGLGITAGNDLTAESDIRAAYVDLDAGRNMTIGGGISTLDGEGDRYVELTAGGTLTTIGTIRTGDFAPSTGGVEDTALSYVLLDAGGDLIVGNVFTGDGETNFIELAAAGNLTLQGDVAAPEVLLSSGGAMAQADGAIITADELALEAGGAITLDEPNEIDTFAIDAPGQSVVVRNDGSFAIGAVSVGAIVDDAVDSVEMAGITAGDIRLQEDFDSGTPMSLTIGAPVNVTGDAIFRTATDIHIEAPVTVTGDGRAIFQAGEWIYVLNDVQTQGGAIHFEADSLEPPGPWGGDGDGDLFLADGTVSSNGGTITLIAPWLDEGEGGIAHFDAGTGDVFIADSDTGSLFIVDDFGSSSDAFVSPQILANITTSGTLTLGQATSLDTDSVSPGAQDFLADGIEIRASIVRGSGNLALASQGGITQLSGATITTDGLALIAGGAVTLDEINAIGTLAVDAPGQSVAVREEDGLSIGTVAGISGIQAASATLTSGGGVEFLASVDGLSSLVVDAGGTVAFRDPVGQDESIGSVSLSTEGDVVIDGRFRAGSLTLDIGGAFTNRNFGPSVAAGEGLDLGSFTILRAGSIESFGRVAGKDGAAAALEPMVETVDPDFTLNGCVIGSTAPCEPAIDEPSPGAPIDAALPRLDDLGDLDDAVAGRFQLRLVPQQLLIPIPSQVSAGGEESLYANDGNEALW